MKQKQESKEINKLVKTIRGTSRNSETFWRCLQHPSSLFVKGSLGFLMTSINNEATYGLAINNLDKFCIHSC